MAITKVYFLCAVVAFAMVLWGFGELNKRLEDIQTTLCVVRPYACDEVFKKHGRKL